MDPDSALINMRDTIAQARRDYRAGDNDTIDALIIHFEALDTWLSRGGYQPNAWSV